MYSIRFDFTAQTQHELAAQLLEASQELLPLLIIHPMSYRRIHIEDSLRQTYEVQASGESSPELINQAVSQMLAEVRFPVQGYLTHFDHPRSLVEETR